MMSPSMSSRPFKDTLADDAYAHDVMRASVDRYGAFSSILSLVSRHSSIVDSFLLPLSVIKRCFYIF